MTLVDTGPFVAHLDESERHHRWANETWATLTEPLTTCEAVLTEACFLLQRWPEAIDALLGRVKSGQLKVESLAAEAAALRSLMKRYRSVPMTYADACLVRLSERFPSSVVITLDTDFDVYRRNGRHVIPLLAPFRQAR